MDPWRQYNKLEMIDAVGDDSGIKKELEYG